MKDLFYVTATFYDDTEKQTFTETGIFGGDSIHDALDNAQLYWGKDNIFKYTIEPVEAPIIITEDLIGMLQDQLRQNEEEEENE